METKFVIGYAAEMQLDVNLNIITSKGAIRLPSLLSLTHTSWIFWGHYTFHQPLPELLFSFSQISVRCFSTPQVRIYIINNNYICVLINFAYLLLVYFKIWKQNFVFPWNSWILVVSIYQFEQFSSAPWY